MAVPSSAALGPEALEEREVLMSIFRPEEFSQRDVDEWVLSFPDLGVDTDLVVRIPPAGRYPALAPPEADIERPIPGLDVRSVVDGLPFTLGETCVYDWACEVRGKLEELLTLLGDDYPAPGRTVSDAGAKTGTSANPFEINDVEDDHAGRSAGAPRSDRLGEDLANFDLSTVAPPEVVVSRPKIEIHHGEPFTEKKSTFQAHVADVNSEADVRHVLEVLYQDNRIRRATHNQYAWRIREGGFSGDRDINFTSKTKGATSTSTTLRADNDDDGEAGAGRKLAELLELMKCENVLCVVSRWYGGIQMGPDRFKCIGRAASELLDKLGKRKK